MVGNISTFSRSGSATSLVSSVNSRLRFSMLRSVNLSTTVSAPCSSYRGIRPRSNTLLAPHSMHASVTVVLFPNTTHRFVVRPIAVHARSMGKGSGSQSLTSSPLTTLGSPVGDSGFSKYPAIPMRSRDSHSSPKRFLLSMTAIGTLAR